MLAQGEPRMKPLAILAAAIGLAFAAPAEAACVFGKVAELPVTMRGLRPTVTVKLNGHDAVFIVDSGAFFSMVSAEAAQRFGMKPTMAPMGLRLRGVGGSTAAAKVARANEFQIAGAPYKNVEFLLSDRLGNGEAVGLLGQNILGSLDVEYDLANGYLRFFMAKDCQEANLAYWSAGMPVSRVALKDPDDKILPKVRTAARIDGRNITVNWDSGSPLSVLSRPAAARVGVRPTSDDVVSGGISYGLFGGGIENSIAPFGSFGIGDEEVKNTRLRIADIELSDADMLLGTDFFLSHRILIARSQNKIYFTYNGGPVFRLGSETRQAQADAIAPSSIGSPAPASSGAGEAKTASEFSLRGSASLARRNYAAAIADFGKAIELEPKEARHYMDRARARLGSGQALHAMADIAESLKLRPGDTEALLTRGALYLASKDEAAAAADFEAARRHAPDNRDLMMRIGQTYNAAGHYEAAIREYDRWLASHAANDAAPRVLNERCWSRALWGKELEAGLADCDAALKKGGRNSSFMDSRGLILLRLGRLDEAIRQYDAALKLQPKQAWSLYGRGLAKLRNGDAAGGRADMAEAAGISPDLPNRVTRLGLATEAETKG